MLGWIVTMTVASLVVAPLLTRHTYSPESAAVTCSSRSREPDTCGRGHGDVKACKGLMGFARGHSGLHGHHLALHRDT